MADYGSSRLGRQALPRPKPATGRPQLPAYRFLIDFVAAVPFDRFASTSQSDRSPVVRLPGLIKIVRLLKLKRTIRKWNGLSYGPLLKVITIVFGWLLVAHWFACALLLDCPTSRHCTQASDEHASYGCASDGWVGER